MTKKKKQQKFQFKIVEENDESLTIDFDGSVMEKDPSTLTNVELGAKSVVYTLQYYFAGELFHKGLFLDKLEQEGYNDVVTLVEPMLYPEGRNKNIQ